MHIREYINSPQEGIVVEEENVLSYYNREIIYRLIMDNNERKHIEVAGFRSGNNKRGINNERKAKFVELVGMQDEKARKEITKELQEKYGGIAVLFWSLP